MSRLAERQSELHELTDLQLGQITGGQWVPLHDIQEEYHAMEASGLKLDKPVHGMGLGYFNIINRK